MAVRRAKNRIVSVLLELAADHSDRQFQRARESIGSNEYGPEMTALLLDAIAALQRLSRCDETGLRQFRRPAGGTSEGDELVPSAAIEVEAILRDEQFLASKEELKGIARRVFRLDFGGSLAKANRYVVIQKLLERFNSSNNDEKYRIYSALRRAYLKTRGSSLAGWSGLIGSKD